jgi:hypothetical protein
LKLKIFTDNLQNFPKTHAQISYLKKHNQSFNLTLACALPALPLRSVAGKRRLTQR